MTLKEKLANDYANEPNSVDEFDLAQKLLMKAAYEAGFEAARELCIERMLGWAYITGTTAMHELREVGTDEIPEKTTELVPVEPVKRGKKGTKVNPGPDTK